MQRFTSLLAFLLVLVTGYGQQVDTKALDRYFSKMAKDWDVPGISIGVIKDGKLVFNGSYGVQEEGKTMKVNGQTNYAIASNSKAFTATLIGMLVDEGKLKWDDKVVKYVPYFEVYDPWVSKNVTVRDLLCHRVGLGTFSGDVIWYKANLTDEDIIRRAKYIPKAFDFRSGYGYSNIMFVVAGKVIETVTGKTWQENVRERILDPLGMDRTIVGPSRIKEVGNTATPHGRTKDKNVPIKWEDWSHIAAMGGLISNVEDMSKWIAFNLNNGIHGQDTLLSAASRNMIWTPHNNFVVDHTKDNVYGRHFNGYALGWGIGDYHGHMRVGHTGGFDGMLSSVALIPDQNLGVVVLTNGMKSPFMAATYYALDQFLNVGDKDWSKDFLSNTNKRKEDKRITMAKEMHQNNTAEMFAKNELAGTYYTPMYGNIYVENVEGRLRLSFEHSPSLSATLKHWHYNVYKIDWDEKHAWYDFGTVQFKHDNHRHIKELSFDVPNNDIFFHELKAVRK